MTDKVVLHEIKHWEKIAAGKTEELMGWGSPAGRRRALRRGKLIAQGSGLASNKKVLEIGCGTGLFTEMFAETGADITAVDLSPELLAKARSRQLPFTQVRFLEKPFEDCEIDGPFDAVIGSSVLHHLDMCRALPKIYSLLKPGGHLSFAEPNMLNPQVFAERHFRHFFPYVSPDETAYIRWKLRKQLETFERNPDQKKRRAMDPDNCCGFTQVSITPFDWLHPSIPEALIETVERLGLLFERMPLIREFSGSLLISARKPSVAPDDSHR